MSRLAAAAGELSQALSALEDSALQPLAEAILSARAVMLYGCGREGLMMRALAMRLHHLGLTVCMQGDMTALPLGPGDLFLCAAGPGRLSTATALVQTARAAGARTWVITAEPGGETARTADATFVIPAQTMARDAGSAALLPMGSLFEGAMFLAFEVLVLMLRDRLGQGPQDMRARHTNME